MPVKTGYHRNLCCMDGTRQSLLNQIADWVANDSCQENVPQRNAYWLCNKTGRWPALFLTLSLTLWQSLHYITLLYITLWRSFITFPYSTLPLGGLSITLHYSTLLGPLFFTLLYMCALYGGRW